MDEKSNHKPDWKVNESYCEERVEDEEED